MNSAPMERTTGKLLGAPPEWNGDWEITGCPVLVAFFATRAGFAIHY